MKKSSAAVVVASLLISAVALAASPDYTRKRAIYNEMGTLRGQDLTALNGPLEKRAAQSKRWATLVQTASKEFGEDHACFKSAHFSQASWQAMNGAVGRAQAFDMNAAASMAYQAGNWAATCYDEIDKLDPPAPTAKR